MRKIGVRVKWKRSSYQSPHLMGNQNWKSKPRCELFMMENLFKVLVSLPLVKWNIYSVVLVELRRIGPRCIILSRSRRCCRATAENTNVIIHFYGSSCRICHLWALLCGLFCIELRFTWGTLVQVHRSASCQLSNLGTKAWREVVSNYGTSVKKAGRIFRVSEMDLALRQRKHCEATVKQQFCLIIHSARPHASTPPNLLSSDWWKAIVYICTLVINHAQRRQYKGCWYVLQVSMQLGKNVPVRS